MQLLAGGGQGRQGRGGGGGGLDDEKSVYYPVMLVALACKSHLKAINVSHGSTGQQKRLLTHVDGLCVVCWSQGRGSPVDRAVGRTVCIPKEELYKPPF